MIYMKINLKTFTKNTVYLKLLREHLRIGKGGGHGQHEARPLFLGTCAIWVFNPRASLVGHNKIVVRIQKRLRHLQFQASKFFKSLGYF